MKPKTPKIKYVISNRMEPGPHHLKEYYTGCLLQGDATILLWHHDIKKANEYDTPESARKVAGRLIRNHGVAIANAEELKPGP